MTFDDMAMANIKATISHEKYFKVPILPSRSSVHTHSATKAPWGKGQSTRGRDEISIRSVIIEVLLE